MDNKGRNCCTGGEGAYTVGGLVEAEEKAANGEGNEGEQGAETLARAPGFTGTGNVVGIRRWVYRGVYRGV